MSENPNGPGGTPDPNSGGENQRNPDGNVSYETHRKLLSEKKRRDDELAEARAKIETFEKAQKEREETEAKQRDDWKKIVELREKEIVELKGKSDQLENRFKVAKKWAVFQEALKTPLESRFYDLVNVDEIVFDPSTNEIDQASVTKVVEKFKVTYGDIIKPKSNANLPSNYPSGNDSGGLDLESWKKLPDKERVKRYAEMRVTENAKTKRV